MAISSSNDIQSLTSPARDFVSTTAHETWPSYNHSQFGLLLARQQPDDFTAKVFMTPDRGERKGLAHVRENAPESRFLGDEVLFRRPKEL
jgi:hypothetical protein